MSDNGIVRVYACGGAGINVSKLFKRFAEQSPTKSGFAQLQVVYIDTSRANARKDVDEADFYYVEGLDGSGKIRSQNYREIAESAKDILLKFPPADLNIVISSLSGGSGATISPVLTSELLERGANVIVSGVASNDSRIEIENTVKTIKSFESIAKLRKLPVVMLYHENEGKSREEVNKAMQADVVSLAALFSRKHRELDSADLKNWLNYPKVTTVEPKLVVMRMCYGAASKDVGYVLTAATLVADGMATSVGVVVDYQCVGYVDPEYQQDMKLDKPMHFLICDDVISKVYKDHANKLANIDEANQARKRSSERIVSDSDNVMGDGLVL